MRLVGATITVDGGGNQSARDPDAYWTFTLAPGTYHLTATATGYQTASKDVTVVTGQEVWASFGLLRDQTTVEVDDAELLEQTIDPLLVSPEEHVEWMWKVKNTGNTTWTSDYHVELIRGEAFGAPEVVPLSEEVPPDAEYIVMLLLTSTTSAGDFEGIWSVARDGYGPFGPALHVGLTVSTDDDPGKDPDPDPDPPIKPPPDMEEPPPMDETPSLSTGPRVSGGCRCAGGPARDGSGWLLLLAGFVLLNLRSRGRATPPARSPAGETAGTPPPDAPPPDRWRRSLSSRTPTIRVCAQGPRRRRSA